MTKLRIVHLLDDTTPGGVTRVIKHICQSERLARNAEHVTRIVPKNTANMPFIAADLIVSHMTVSWRSLPGLISLRAKHPHIPLVHIEHSYTKAFTALNVAKRERFFGLLRTAYALFDKVVAVSRAQHSWMITREVVSPARSCVIRSAVDLSEFSALEAPKGRCLSFGAVGRLEPQKGFDTLIKAFKFCEDPDARLNIFGEGSQREMLEDTAKDDPRIVFHGHVSDPVQAMKSLDALLVPSRWEAYGLVAQEGLAARRRTVVAHIDGLTDQIEDGAIPVQSNTVSAWAQAIRDSLKADLQFVPETQKTLETRAKGVFERHWETLIARTVAKEIADAA